jgi:hypothetical protein
MTEQEVAGFPIKNKILRGACKAWEHSNAVIASRSEIDGMIDLMDESFVYIYAVSTLLELTVSNG